MSDVQWPQEFEVIRCCAAQSYTPTWIVRSNRQQQLEQTNLRLATLRKTLHEAEAYVKLLENAMDEFENNQDDSPAVADDSGEVGAPGRMTTADYENCETELDARDLEIMNLNQEIEAAEKQRQDIKQEVVNEIAWLDTSDRPAVEADDEEIEKQQKVVAIDGTSVIDVDPTSDSKLAVKILQPLSAVQDQVASLKAVKRDPQGCADLILDANNLKQNLDAFIESHGASVTSAHIVPILNVRQLSRHVPDLEDEYCVAVSTQYCVKGSIERWIDAIKLSDSKYFNSNFLFTNAKALLETLDDLSEGYERHHLGLRPSNLFVSRDGQTMMIGDWLPESHRLRLWTNRMFDRIFISPELYLLKEQQRKGEITLTEDLIRQKIDLYSHDLFCLGLCFYYLITKSYPDKRMHKSQKFLSEQCLSLASPMSELVVIIRGCLKWKPSDRTSSDNRSLLNKATRFFGL